MKLNYQVLIVDDVSENIQVAMNILKECCLEFSFALNGKEALELMEKSDFDLILLDVMMPDLSGFEVCKRMKANPALADIPVIFLTARVDVESITKAFDVGGVDFISKPFQPEELISRVNTHLELRRTRLQLEHQNNLLQSRLISKEKRISAELEMNQVEMISILTELMEATSDETGAHLIRVAEIARLLAKLHGSLSEDEINIIFHAAPMHDIGKIAVPIEILHSPNKLTKEERIEMQKHTLYASRFLQHSNRKFIKAASIIALQHHEKWDGTGYPHGLKGDEIHIFGRIVAVADVFDALTHERKYKDAWTVEESLNYIIENSGTHFDPSLVEILTENIEEFKKVLAVT